MEWFGGKPVGCIHLTNGSYQVLLNRIESKCFSKSQCGSLENAYNAAEEWQYEESTHRGLTKNMIRVIDLPNEEPYLEVKLQNGHIMICDVEHIDLVENSIWTSWRGKDKKVSYARRRASKKLQQEYIMFHTLICPDYSQVDHINRNGLDNRSINLREGVKVNPKNKGKQVNNVSGVTGVRYDRSNTSWAVQIGGTGNRRRCSFAVKTYGYREAYNLAVKTRKKWEKELEYGG